MKRDEKTRSWLLFGSGELDIGLVVTDGIARSSDCNVPATLKVNDYFCVLVGWVLQYWCAGSIVYLLFFSSKQDSYRDLVTLYQYTVYCIGISIIVLSDDMCAVHITCTATGADRLFLGKNRCYMIPSLL